MDSSSRTSSTKSTIVILMIFVFMALGMLGFFRFQTYKLEYVLNNINRSIERYSAEEVELKQVFSGLVSPIKIYSYCKDMLGMDKTNKVETVQVTLPYMMAAQAPSPQKGWRANLLSFFGWNK